VTCGIGRKIRYRYCENPIPRYGGNNCLGVRRQSAKCVMEHCPGNLILNSFLLYLTNEVN